MGRVRQKVKEEEKARLQAVQRPTGTAITSLLGPKGGLPRTKADLQKLCLALGIDSAGLNIEQMQKQCRSTIEAYKSMEGTSTIYSGGGSGTTTTTSTSKDNNILDENEIVTFGQQKGRRFSEVPEDYLRWAINEVENSETCHVQLRRLATWAKVELGGPTLSQAAPTPGNQSSSASAPSTPQSLFVVPETMIDMTQMVDQLRARFGDEMMYMAWANGQQSNPAQMFNLQQQQDLMGMEWTSVQQQEAEEAAL